MPTTMNEGRIRFDFPDSWIVLRPGEAAFYLRHYQNFCGGSKEMDFVLFDPAARILWLLEVKDYTTDPRTKEVDLMEEIASKARDTLGLIVAAAAKDTTHPATCGEFSRVALPPQTIRVVLHLEQPSCPSKLFPAVKLAADSMENLRQKVRCIDPHARVTSISDQRGVSWTAAWVP